MKKLIEETAEAIYEDVRDLRGENVAARFKSIVAMHLRTLLSAAKDQDNR